MYYTGRAEEKGLQFIKRVLGTVPYKEAEVEGRADRKIRYIISFFILLVLLLLLIFWNIRCGSVSISFDEIWDILKRGMSDSVYSDTQSQIIRNIRMPRIFAVILLGGSLSVSGFLLQTFFANPIAGPFVLGISSGAKLVVALFMVFALGKGFYFGSWSMIGAAFLGAMLSMGFILLISLRVNRMSVLVICGVMIGYICSAATDFVVTFADDSNIVNLHNWSLGSFSGTTWENVGVMAVVTVFCMAFAFLLSKPMEAYQMGEAYARNIGVPIRAFRFSLILLSSLLAASVTAFAGPVSFVGIAVPHLMKSLLKTAKPILLTPACFLGGAGFCLFCDMIARTLFSPVELSISSVTAVFGAPIVIYMMVKRRN